MQVVTTIKHYRGGGQLATPQYVDALVSADVQSGPGGKVLVGPIASKLEGGEVLTLSVLETWWAHVALTEAFLDQSHVALHTAPLSSF